MQVTLSPVHDFAALGTEWRAVEADVAGLSFFQSWTWVGCRAEERYPDPVLVRAVLGGRTVGLALLNRRRGRLCLAESGDPTLDAPFIEHNAPLVAAAAPGDAPARLLREAWRVPGVRRLVLGGVAPQLVAGASGVTLRRLDRAAPLVDLAALRAGGGDHLASRSANTRQQLRRSARSYAARGPLRLDRAADGAEALRWFDRLRALHDRTWGARDKPGAFATPFLERFHRALIGTAAARGELDLLRVMAGDGEVGYLYNLRLAGRVSAYQSGLDLAGAGTHEKPGLTCHALAVQRALAAGDSVYDFLAGDAQYKRSLATGAAMLTWAELVRAWSPLGLTAALRRLAGV